MFVRSVFAAIEAIIHIDGFFKVGSSRKSKAPSSNGCCVRVG